MVIALMVGGPELSRQTGRPSRRWKLVRPGVALRSLPLLAVACAQGGGASSFTPEQLAAAEHVCYGQDQEVGDCPPQEPCKDCTPIHCEFSAWGGWYDSGGCVGLKFRHRVVNVASNECGKPCRGAKIESTPSLKAECAAVVRDCAFEQWTAWSPCASIMDQAVRSRGILLEPTADGTPCEGNTRQTRPCGGPERRDCQVSTWREWTQCSASCGEGRHSRMRHILVEAGHGGRTCDDILLEVKTCSVQECLRQECVLNEWSEWSGWEQCVQHGHGQRMRRRGIAQTPSGGAAPCPEVLMETAPCPGLPAADCEVTAWTAWSDCTKSCLGGLKYRRRELKTPNIQGGACPLLTLKAVEACNAQPCEQEITDCALSSWTAWSDCSVTVGKGARSRTRAIESPATDQGRGCTGPLAEVGGCMVMDLAEADCVWADWAGWTECSASCGGGQMRRSRVVERSAENGGAPCKAEVKSQVAPCNTDECDKGCVDAKWADWLDWTDCSASCGSGLRSRVRSLHVKANECGKPATGATEEFEACDGLPSCVEDRDCQLAPWEPWSNCTRTCFGIRERKRHIAVFAEGGGKPCESVSLKAVEPCNPGEGAAAPAACGGSATKDCVLSNWSQWGPCSATCGGGQRQHLRMILATASAGGLPCEDSLTVTEPCNVEACPVVECQDCIMHDWSDWSACEQCGGQRTRSRAIKQLPNACGTPCVERSTKEISTCTSTCERNLFCAWTEWAAPACSNKCGQSTSTRSRELQLSKDSTGEYLFKANSESQCQGTQVVAVECPALPNCTKVCTPRNCAFSNWGEWAAATCVGLCERQRIITTMNNECGVPCTGELVTTKPCPSLCDGAQDCVLSTWSPWTKCPSATQGQRYRHRKILQQPTYEGVACNAPLNETRACNVPDPEPCRFQGWSSWGACSKKCGVGVKTRTRGVSDQAQHGGEQCSGSLMQMQPCSEHDCFEEPTQSCVFDMWTDWSSCNTDGQRERSRSILRAASGHGHPCDGPMHETDICRNQAVDCKVSEWTHWDACDRTCGGGQTRRERQIQDFPMYGGEVCPDVMIETRGCHDGPCSVRDCLVSGWAAWTPCSTSCGTGMQSRTRDVVRERGEGGVGCFWELGETRRCPEQPSCGIKDCKLSGWGDWGGCSVPCGGGFRRRLKEIVQLPDIGGRTCRAEVMEEVDPCNMAACQKTCVDGAFSDWSPWAPCSVSCEGGTTFRTRQVARMANDCGRQPEGLDREEKFCNLDVPCEAPKDCTLDQWTSWSECSATCSGLKRRSRTVAEYGRGSGQFCLGSLKETFPCNPSQGETTPEACMPAPDVDCIMSEWEGWSACSSSCGGGQHVRSRSIVQHSANNGRPCEAALSEVSECARNSCSGPRAVDCEYGEWEDWQPCLRCDGERKRVRKLLSFAANGGRACTDFTSAEVEECPRTCGLPTFCGWSKWGEWQKCSTKCGTGGKRTRRRSLEISSKRPEEPPPRVLNQTSHLTDAGILDNTLRRYEVLYEETKDLESAHLPEILAAFCLGSISLVAGLAVLRGAHVSLRPSPPTFRRQHGDSLFRGARASVRSAEALTEALALVSGDVMDEGGLE